MDKDPAGAGIQDRYLDKVRKDRSWLTVVLNGGKTIGGRVISFDRYTVLLEDKGRELMVFKHAIATIAAARAFANPIDFDAKRRGREGAPADAVAPAKPGAPGAPGVEGPGTD
jgi:host factor-I protein